jgi:hypothetical protein
MYSTTEVFTQENTMVTHEVIYTSILSPYAIYRTFKWMSHILDNKYLLKEQNNMCLSIA